MVEGACHVADGILHRQQPSEAPDIAVDSASWFAWLNDPQQFLVHDVAFHRAVAAASGNPTLATLVEMVSAILYERRRNTIERAHDFNEALELHRRVYKAIRSHKPDEAREAMREHIVRAQRAFALEEKQQVLQQKDSSQK